MDAPYLLTDRADEDLFEISLYLARQASIETAERFIRDLHRKFALLADNHGLGRQREELAPSLRSIPQGNYIVFYRSDTEHLLIVRVLHGSRDMNRAFEGGDPETEPEDP
jgi:toxin ParE1/3/4